MPWTSCLSPGSPSCCILTFRAQDYAKSATGEITIESDGVRIRGRGTAFSAEFRAGDAVYVSGHLLPPVQSVISDTEMVLTKPVAEDVRKVLEAPVRFKHVPYLDQSVVYDAVHQRLRLGGCIGIFPEGGSHDRAEMLPLKAGVAIMALGAMAQWSDLDVKIIPCGYD